MRWSYTWDFTVQYILNIQQSWKDFTGLIVHMYVALTGNQHRTLSTAWYTAGSTEIHSTVPNTYLSTKWEPSLPPWMLSIDSSLLRSTSEPANRISPRGKSSAYGRWNCQNRITIVKPGYWLPGLSKFEAPLTFEGTALEGLPNGGGTRLCFLCSTCTRMYYM